MALIDPTTGRQVYTGPQGEGGSASRAAMEAEARRRGVDPSTVQASNVGGTVAFYIPGVAIQAGNRAALGLGYQPGLTSTAPGADPAVLAQLGGQSAPPKPTRDFASEARLLFPWIPDALRQVFVDAWSRYGDPNLALGALRQDARYEQFFPGNKRADGSIALGEGEYLSNVEGYDRALRMFGQNPGDYKARYGELIQGGKSPDEFAADLAEVQVEVLQQAPAVREKYAEFGYSADISDAAIFASRLNDGVSPHVFEQRFRSAQIGAEAATRGFVYGRGQAERLAQAGVDQSTARQLFGQAAAEIPTLNELMGRFNDPEDDLTLDEYTDAIVLRDPEHLRSIARVLTRERSSFSDGDLLARDQAGGVVGLRQR